MRRGLRRCLLSVEVIHAQELRGGWPPNSHHAGGSLVESAKAMINRRGFLHTRTIQFPGNPCWVPSAECAVAPSSSNT